jgi:hypothetical protein
MSIKELVNISFIIDLINANNTTEGGLFEYSDGETFDGMDTQLEFLYNLITKIKPKNIIEIGTHCALFDYFCLSIDPEIKITTFGINPISKVNVDMVNKYFNTNNITFIEGDSVETFSNYNSSADLIWIDGGHSKRECSSDLQNAFRLNIKHILIDDYRDKHNNNVKDSVIEFSNKLQYVSESQPTDTRGIVYLMNTNKNRKAIWILNIDNKYNPELVSLCVPTIKAHADKINADLNIITERKFPDWHITYEKAQVYELGKSYDWNIVMDTDMLIHPDLPDLTERVPDFVIGIRDNYSADGSFYMNDYFYRDRRKIGISGVFAMASKYCHDFWTPLPGKQEDYLSQIHMRPEEKERGVKPEHFITEYWLSSNLAKYGLKYDGLLFEQERYMLFHTFFAPLEEQKLKELKDTLKNWELNNYGTRI